MSFRTALCFSCHESFSSIIGFNWMFACIDWLLIEKRRRTDQFISTIVHRSSDCAATLGANNQSSRTTGEYVVLCWWNFTCNGHWVNWPYAWNWIRILGTNFYRTAYCDSWKWRHEFNESDLRKWRKNEITADNIIFHDNRNICFRFDTHDFSLSPRPWDATYCRRTEKKHSCFPKSLLDFWSIRFRKSWWPSFKASFKNEDILLWFENLLGGD